MPTGGQPILACILAGGQSLRMGRAKAALRLGQRSMLAEVRAAATKAGLPVKVVRRDIVPACGPLGGIYTALATMDAAAVLFLACDMPFVSAATLSGMRREFQRRQKAVFMRHRGLVGFPCLLEAGSLPVVARQIQRKEWSLQKLFKALKAGSIEPTKATELLNVNTPADLETARRLHRAARRAVLAAR